ncbi:MAG: alanine:cation symporter family protein, partial [Pygmaiobacter sp.]
FTALVILVTGEWTTGVPGSVLAINAFQTGLGVVGKYIAPLCLTLFAFSTVIALATFVQLQVEALWGKLVSKIVSCIYLFMIVLGLYGVDVIIPFSDLANALLILCSLSALMVMSKMLRSETKNYFSTIAVENEKARKELKAKAKAN